MNKEAEKFFAQECNFIIGAVAVADLPTTNLPEIAFIGRSNVGKSTLINSFLNRKVAKVSNTPGRTRQLNFFLLAEKLHIVDLPGYGYAKASKREVKGWNELIYDYLRGRVQLKRIFMLVDSRHGLKKNDLEMIKFLGNYPNTTQIILTKIDKIKPIEKKQICENVQNEILKHAICHNQVIVTSSITKDGLTELREEIFQLIQH